MSGQSSQKYQDLSNDADKLEPHELREVLKADNARDLYNFIHHQLGYQQMVERVHRPICETLTSETKRKLICVPRGTFKSTICSVGFPIWLLNNNPNLRILLDSELYTNSKNFLREIKGHMTGRSLIDLYGEYQSNTWNEGELIIKQRTKTMAAASISCGGVETNKVSQHFDCIVFDDMNSDNNSQTEEGRQKVINHFKMAISLLEPDGIIVVVGTRYSASDLIGFIMENEIEVH